MPATHDEIVEIARRLARMQVNLDSLTDVVWADGDGITRAEEGECCALALYEYRQIQRRQGTPAQRKARKLLVSLLSAEQRRHLRDSNNFRVTGSLGGHYRLYPGMGTVRRVEQHGRKFFEVQSFCIHEVGKALPPADTTIGHMLLLLSDEGEFLMIANASKVKLPDCWNGEYLKRMRGHRLNREQVQRILSGHAEEGAVVHIDRDPEAAYILGIAA